MSKISICIAVMLLALFSSCKNRSGETVEYDVPTIKANLPSIPQTRIDFVESGEGGIEGNNGGFNNDAFVKLEWNTDDIMRLYDTDNSDSWAADFILIDGAGGSQGVFQIIDGGLIDGHTYKAAVMSNTTYQTEKPDKTYPVYSLPSEESNVAVNEVSYIGNNIIIGSVGENAGDPGLVTYKGGDYVGAFSFKPNFSLFTFLITCPPEDSGFKLTDVIKTFEMEGSTTTGGKFKQTLNLSDVSGSELTWTAYNTKKVLYVPFWPGDYSSFAFVMTTEDDDTYGCYAETQAQYSNFKEGVRYKRSLTDWTGVDLDLEGYFGFADITGDFKPSTVNW